jgi:hypothetical protein
MANIGGSQFQNVLVPLAFGSRYFILDSDDPPDLSVVDLTAAGPEWEIVRNQPRSTSVSVATKTPPGIVTVTDRATGRFVYTLRPGAETSLVFGTLRGNEVECVIRDGSVRIGTNTVRLGDFRDLTVGVLISPNGDVRIGGTSVPAPVAAALRSRPK